MSQVKLADSNIALLGSDLELEVRSAAAASEEQFSGAGDAVGLEKWRVANFGVQREESSATLYDGDCYIVLQTYLKGDKKCYNVYFWLGSECSQDESTVAAYKTVELDDLLGCAPVQYREVSGHESDEFLAVFGGQIELLSGGIDSAFNVVKPEEYVPRLLHIKGTSKAVRVQQVEKAVSSMNKGDAFLLDKGLELFVFFGDESGAWERRKGNAIANQLKEQRSGKPSITIVDGESDDNEAFWAELGGKSAVPPASAAGADDEVTQTEKKLYKLSDESGELTCTEVDFARASLDSDDVFIVDLGVQIFAWVGQGASKQEKANAVQIAAGFVKQTGRPAYTPIVRVVDGSDEPSAFVQAFE